MAVRSSPPAFGSLIEQRVLTLLEEGKAPLYLPAALAKEGVLDLAEPGTPGSFSRACEFAFAVGGGRDLGIALAALVPLTVPRWLLSQWDARMRDRYLRPAMSLCGLTDVEVTREGTWVVLRGIERAVVNVPHADIVLVLARGPNACYCPIAAPVDSPGLALRPLDNIGSLSLYRAEFDSCRLAAEYVIDAVAAELSRALAQHYVILACAAIRMADEVLRALYSHADTRRMFGQTMARLQVVAHRLADHTASYRIAAAYLEEVRNGANPAGFVRHAAMACTAVAAMVRRLLEDAVQLFGGRAYLTDHWVGRLYRDWLSLEPLVSPRDLLMCLAAEGETWS